MVRSGTALDWQKMIHQNQPYVRSFRENREHSMELSSSERLLKYIKL